MEMLLLALTVISLIVAFVMSAAAWKLAREERTRSSARVAALAAAASAPAVATASSAAAIAPIAPIARPAEAESTVRIAPRPSVEPAAEPLAVGDLRPAPWATARVSTFATPKAALTPRANDLLLRDTTAGELLVRETTAGLGESFLGGSITPPPSSGRQRGLAIAAAVLFVALAGGGYWMIFGQSTATAATADAPKAPLELVSLRHERRGGRLAVTGLVRNPAAGAPVEKLAAVVFLFDRQGGFVTSARAEVDFTRLSPGDESPFVINIDASGAVARYRVSFRNEAGVVPHVDRRGEEPVAASIGS
jgi:hypothetical protein